MRPDEVDYVLRKIHEGIYENYLEAKSLAYKALRKDYYWPTMHEMQ